MSTPSALAQVAALVGDPARAAMLDALMDGEARSASALATLAGITPQTASGHLARLVEGGLLVVEVRGRARLHRIASADVAAVIEGLQQLAAPLRSAAPARLRAARTCYDHLAGRFGVAIGEAVLTPLGEGVTPWGERAIASLGIDLREVQRSRRPFVRTCVDWSERVPHLAGALGAALCARCFELGWVRRVPGTRAVEVTREGALGASRVFGLAG